MKRNQQPFVPIATSAPKIMTVDEVAQLLKIPRSSVYEKTRSRPNSAPPLPCRRIGKYLRFLESEVLAWLMALPQNNLVKRRPHRKAA